MSDRHNATGITGKTVNIYISFLLFMLCFAVFLVVWQMLVWQEGSDVGYYYSSPLLTAEAFVVHFWDNLDDTVLTAGRGLSGILVGFFFVYPLGSWLALVGFLDNFGRILVLLLLAVAQLAVIMLFLQFTGSTGWSVVLIGYYFAFVKMLAFGYFDTHSFLRDEEYKGILEYATISGFRRWAFYRTIVGPLLFRKRLDSLYILSVVVWSSVSFAESYVGGHIGGIGVRIQITSEQFGTLAWFYSASLMLTFLVLLGWVLIYMISRLYPNYGASSEFDG